jgi:hypothetical protein
VLKRLRTKRAALGFRAHSGWAALVAVAGPAETPVVVLRRRLVIADPDLSGSKQPYHAAEPMAFPDAEAFINRCADSTRSMAKKGVRDAVTELTSMGFAMAGSCVLLGSGRPLGDLAKILLSHPLIHTAEGEFYRNALKQACESCGLAFSGVKERELMGQAAAALGIRAAEIENRVSQLGKTVGPPWRQDEKLSAIAAWIVLADQH